MVVITGGEVVEPPNDAAVDVKLARRGEFKLDKEKISSSSFLDQIATISLGPTDVAQRPGCYTLRTMYQGISSIQKLHQMVSMTLP